VGFEIDLHLIATNFPLIASIVSSIIVVKASVATALCAAFGLSFSNAQQVGMLLCQGGEFAFVTFGMARGLGILTVFQTKILLTSVALTMAVTPALVAASEALAKRIEENSGFTHYMGEDRDASEIKESEDFVVVVGYGTVGRLICDLLDSKLIRYIGIEANPNRAIEARNRGLPVFYGDVTRPDVAEAFSLGKAKGCVITISDKLDTNRAVITLRLQYPNLQIFARAKDAAHQLRLTKTLGVVARVPILPEDNLLMTLPFGGAVLSNLGSPIEEVNAILETKRKEMLAAREAEHNADRAYLSSLMGVVGNSGRTKEEKAGAEKNGEVAAVAEHDGEETAAAEEDDLVTQVIKAGEEAAAIKAGEEAAAEAKA